MLLVTLYWVSCDGLASHPGGVVMLLVTLCYRNQTKALALMCHLAFSVSIGLNMPLTVTIKQIQWLPVRRGS